MCDSLADQIEREATSRPFAAVQQGIDALPVPSEQKEALWLLAWSVQTRDSQRILAREIARATLERLASAGT